MNSTDRRSTRYKTLAAQGVTCGELRQTISPSESWTLQCRKIDALDNESAKQLVKEFLQDEWEAYRISFFRRVGTSPQIFYASFKSEAL